MDLAVTLTFQLIASQEHILIDRNGHACIAGFSLLTMTPDQMGFVPPGLEPEGGMTQWMSPELLDPGQFGLVDCCSTKESDCYALGMVIYEVLSGRSPFAQCIDGAVVLKVLDGERPARPRGVEGAWFTDVLWEILERCWRPQPHDRPSVDTVLECLEAVSWPSGLPSSDEKTDTHPKNQSDPTAIHNSGGDLSDDHSSELPVLRIRAGDTKITCSVLVLNLIT